LARPISCSSWIFMKLANLS